MSNLGPTSRNFAESPSSQPDTVGDRLAAWGSAIPAWGPAEDCRERTARFVRRSVDLRKRVDRPLVVAMLGGTGTGKSTLLNALVGEKVVRESKERPTTEQPILVCQNGQNPEKWGVDLSDVRIEQHDLPALEQMSILDCPDPDTTENDQLRETNLARLRAVLPLCDVLLVTATQQKYRSRRVLDELAAAAPGARLVFVQTHADLDVDIREDWRQLLEKDYETGQIFLVDSAASLKIQQQEVSVTAIESKLPEEFRQLRQLLTRDLNDEAAIRIRQANYFSLAEEAVGDCRKIIDAHWPAVGKLRERISEERRRFGDHLAEKMRDELIRDRRLWESRLLGRVASQWGYSPFSLILRVYQGFGAILSGTLLARARSVPQLAVWGAFEGVRSLRKWSANRKVEAGPGSALLSTYEENRLRESALILAGFANDAEMPTAHCEPEFVLKEAQAADEIFIADIARELEGICDRLAQRNNLWWTRSFYEGLFGGMILFILIRPAKNFFYDTVFFSNRPLLGIDFYLQSIFWLLIWGALLLGLFTFMLRNGLDRQINETATQWNRLSGLHRFFAAIEDETNRILSFRAELDQIGHRVDRINQQAEKLDRRLGMKKVR